MKFDRRRLATVALAIALLVGGLGLGTAQAQAQDEGTPININTADEVELMMLKGIGEAKAKAIIEYREAQSFETIEDIMKVSGIGDKTFENIKDRITVGETADE
jgi:competence protein ComEA